MSKAFTKDDDGAADAPLLVSRRAPLPAGMPNYVTPRGLALLHAELAKEQGTAAPEPASDGELARAAALANARRAELEARIASAVVVESALQAHDEVRFGASVTLRNLAGAERTYRIVGVDEANPSESRLAFVAPLSRSLLGKKVGEVASVKTPAGDDELEILAIRNDAG
jgi:transcription elongation factor GreB